MIRMKATDAKKLGAQISSEEDIEKRLAALEKNVKRLEAISFDALAETNVAINRVKKMLETIVKTPEP